MKKSERERERAGIILIKCTEKTLLTRNECNNEADNNNDDNHQKNTENPTTEWTIVVVFTANAIE